MKKIVVLESYVQYAMVIGYAVMLGMSQFMLGMCLMGTIIMSSCNKYYDLHHWYCFFGGQLLFGEGILAFNYADGWASSLPLRYRRVIHPTLQIVGICYYIYGSLAGLATGRSITDLHVLTGSAALVSMLGAAVFGVLTLRSTSPEDNKKSKLHIGLGVLTYVLIAITSVLGFSKSNFDRYARLAYLPSGGSSILFSALTAFYTIAILVRPVKRLLFTYIEEEPKNIIS